MGAVARNTDLPSFNPEAEALQGYFPTEPVLDTDVVYAEVATTRAFLASDPANTDQFAADLVASLKRTQASGQPVEGEILASRDPLAAVRTAMRDALKPRDKAEELPDGVLRGTVSRHVVDGWVVAYSDRGHGKGPILQNGNGARLKEGDPVTFTLTGESDSYGHPIAVLYQPEV